MKYSIIIPVHNAEKWITRSVESLVHQWDDIQIILVENNSSDDSENVCRELENKYKQVELYRSKNGVSFARNLGLQKARGEIIGFCDADDYFENGVFNYIDHCFRQYDVGIVITGFYYDSPNDGSIHISAKHEEVITASKAIENVLCNPSIMGSVWNKFYRKSMLKDIAFLPELTHMEDGYFNISVLTQNRDETVYISKKPTYHYVHNERSATEDIDRIFDDNNRLKYIVALDKISELPGLYSNERKYVKCACCRLAIIHIQNNYVKEDIERFNYLYDNIIGRLLCLLVYGYKYQHKETIKLFLKGLRAVFGGRK